jgi:hypothetical protein
MNFSNGNILIPEQRGNKQVLVNKKDSSVLPLDSNQNILSIHLSELPEDSKYKNLIIRSIHDPSNLKIKDEPCKNCNASIYTILRLGSNEIRYKICNGCNKVY